MASNSASETKNELSVDTAEPFKRQGSFRKVLPGAESQLSMSAKMIDRPALSSRAAHKAYSQFQQEYTIIAEYNILRKQEVPGVYVIPSAQSSLLWFGVIFVRQGLYQGGVFRFTIHIPEGFPDGGCPKVVFQSTVFHPLINGETGEMDVKTGFHEWRRNVNHVWQLVQYIRRAFYKIETKSAVNMEASELYENSPEEFRERVSSCVKQSQDHVYDPPPTDDPHYITFEPFDNELHGPVRDAIFKLKDNEEEPSSLGLSWVQPGSLQPFSKPTS